MRGENPWGGLREAAVGFVLAHAALATFFLDEHLPHALAVGLKLVLAAGGPLYLLAFALRGRGGTQAGLLALGTGVCERGEDAEVTRLLDEFDDDEGDDAFGGAGLAVAGPDGDAAAFPGGGLRSPFSLTRRWVGFEEDGGGGGATAWGAGQTCALRPQVGRTAALRALVVGLSATTPCVLPVRVAREKQREGMTKRGTTRSTARGQSPPAQREYTETHDAVGFNHRPSDTAHGLLVQSSLPPPPSFSLLIRRYYMFYLANWMWVSFGIAGAFFVVAEAVATAARWTIDTHNGRVRTWVTRLRTTLLSALKGCCSLDSLPRCSLGVWPQDGVLGAAVERSGPTRATAR